MEQTHCETTNQGDVQSQTQVANWGFFGVVIMMVKGEAFDERLKTDGGRSVEQEEAKRC